MNEKVLVIDDDPEFLSLMKVGLEREGLIVIIAESGKEAIRRAYETQPDVIIVDLMMPDMDGWTLCQRFRHLCDTPIIVLTARTGQGDVLKSLSLGADDHIIKPCSFEELLARIRTVLRRAGAGVNGNWRASYDDGNLFVDVKEGTVARRGEELRLTPIEMRLLLYLVSRRGRIVPHRELLTNVWGPEYAGEVSYLSVYIRYLRRKIEDDPANPRYIRTRWGMGYYFAGGGALQEAGQG